MTHERLKLTLKYTIISLNSHLFSLQQDKLEEERTLGSKMFDICQNLIYDDPVSVCDEEDCEEDDGLCHGREFEFIPTEWLEKFFENPQAVSVIETKNLVCIHDNMDIDKICHVKVIDPEVVSNFGLSFSGVEPTTFKNPQVLHTAGSDHCFRKWRLSVSTNVTFQN